MTRRQFSREFKREAVQLVLDRGVSVAQAARDLDLHLDGKRPGAKPIATEFVTTSITSSGDGVDKRPDTLEIQKENECLKWFNSQRGYVICDVKRDQWLTEFKVVDTISTKGGKLTTRKRMTVDHGAPGSLTQA